MTSADTEEGRFKELRQSSRFENELPQKLPYSQCTRLSTHRLSEHSQIHQIHALKSELRSCDYCSKVFSSKAAVRAHIKRMHSNERPFVCEKCGMSLRTLTDLKSHAVIHTDNAPFQCAFCRKGFKNQFRLNAHLEIHEPNKYVCAVCGMQLNSRATFSRHKVVHSEVKRHKCDFCGRAFKRAMNLKSHLILHAGLKPFVCDFCDRAFGNNSNCRTHKRKVHPAELAALEAEAGREYAGDTARASIRRVPNLETLKTFARTNRNLEPVIPRGKNSEKPQRSQSF